MKLIIYKDPAGINGREMFDLDPSKTFHENIASHLSTGVGCTIAINGREVDPITDTALDDLPSDGDVLSIVSRPGWEGVGAAIYYIYYAVMIAYVIYAVTNRPKVPNAPSATSKDSPNNSLTGQTNIARVYQAIPDVYGYRRVWPDLIQASTIEYIDQLKYVTEWMCISRGVGTITDVRYADTPIADIDGSSYEIFQPSAGAGYAENRTTTINDVYQTYASPEVNGQEIPELKDGAQVTSSATITHIDISGYQFVVVDGSQWDDLKNLGPGDSLVITSTNYPTPTQLVIGSITVGAGNITVVLADTGVTGSSTYSDTIAVTPLNSHYTTLGPYTMTTDGDQLWWSTIFPRGLYGTVQIKAEWWKINGAGVEIGGTRQNTTHSYTASTFNDLYYTKKVTPSGGNGRYRIQFTRLTPVVGSNGSGAAKLEEVYAVKYFSTKTLPGCTIIRVTTKATLSATGFSDRKFNMRWNRHVRTLTSDTVSASRNFARAMAHMWTIAGNDIAGLDTTALQAINTELGESSDLLRFDGSLDDADISLGERLQLMASNARCQVWRDGTKWTVSREQARPWPVMQLDYRNLASNGDSSIAYASHLPASNDGVEIAYVDESAQQKRAYIRYNTSTGVPVEGNGSNLRKIQLLSCATESQARNRALVEARKLIYSRVTVQDTVLSDAMTLGIGSLVRWIDPGDFGGDGLQAGEVIEINGATITTSEPLDWKGQQTGRMLFTGSDGRTIVGAIQVTRTPSENKAILASVPTGLYVSDSDRQLGSRYAFAVGLTQAETESAGLYTVTELRPNSDGTVSLSLAQYDARIFQDD